MELLAVLFALKLINNPNVQINIISDSEYAVNCTKKGINIKNGTYIEYRIDYKNKDIIDILYNQIQYFTNLNISWTRGHDGNENNNIADKLASIAYHDSKNNKIKDSGYFTKDVINDIKLFKK
jgi:ribonuclease HI